MIGESLKGKDIEAMVQPNRNGWFAIRHKDEWWVGTDKGTTCYQERDLARYALTLIWQRDGGRRLDFRIFTFTGADANTGEYTPKKSAKQALKDYELSSMR